MLPVVLKPSQECHPEPNSGLASLDVLIVRHGNGSFADEMPGLGWCRGFFAI